MSLWCTPLGLGLAPLSLGMCLWVWGEQLGFGVCALEFGENSIGFGHFVHGAPIASFSLFLGTAQGFCSTAPVRGKVPRCLP